MKSPRNPGSKRLKYGDLNIFLLVHLKNRYVDCYNLVILQMVIGNESRL